MRAIYGKKQTSIFTARCGGDKNGVVIYRKEEWFKVFLHETMHYFAFDENLDNNELIDEISDFFLLKKKIKVYEAYCEFWSRIMNSVFIAFMLCNGNDNGNDNGWGYSLVFDRPNMLAYYRLRPFSIK